MLQVPQRATVPAYALDGIEAELAAQIAPVQQRPAAAQAGQQRPAPHARATGETAVRIGPFRPDPSLVTPRHNEAEIEQLRASEAARAAAAERFIPPAAERPEESQARMPRVEDFPPVIQRQLRPQQQQAARKEEEDRKPRGLLARLTSGLTRQAGEAQEEAPRQRQQNRPTSEIEAPRIAPIPVQQNAPANTAAEFTRQAQPRRMGEAHAATGTLDPRGRPIPANPAETIIWRSRRSFADSPAENSGLTLRNGPARVAGPFSLQLERDGGKADFRP